MEDLHGKKVFITGSAHRLGKAMALAAARSGADIILHHGHSAEEAQKTSGVIQSLGRKCWILKADLNSPDEIETLISKVFELSPVFCLVNNASIFPSGGMLDTSFSTWQESLNINLTAPFLLSQAFIQNHRPGDHYRIINLVDWRALRPGKDHFAYTICKAALASLTSASALAGAPDVSVNALALGAILPPADQTPDENIISQIPLKRWATLEEFEEAFLSLLTGPSYINGEIIHLDGGRHIV